MNLSATGVILAGNFMLGGAPSVAEGASELEMQLALEEAQGGAGERIMQGLIKDPAFPEGTWAKMQWVHEGLTSGKNIVIHYWKNLETGVTTGFKYK